MKDRGEEAGKTFTCPVETAEGGWEVNEFRKSEYDTIREVKKGH